MDHKREDRTPPTSKGHGSGQTTTMIQIPKNRKQLLCNSSNYIAIALNSILSKILDWVILIKEKSALCSSHLQFGFKKGMSTAQCTYRMPEMVNYYNFNKSNVFVLMSVYPHKQGSGEWVDRTTTKINGSIPVL